MKTIDKKPLSRLSKKPRQKTPFEIIEEKFGKRPVGKSTEELVEYFNARGYESLSRLIENK